MAIASRLTIRDADILHEAAEQGLFTEEFAGKHIAISGSLSMSKVDVGVLIQAVGGHWDTTVNAGTNYLLVGDTGVHGMTSKINKAIEMGITVLEEREFVEKLSVFSSVPGVPF